MRLIRQAKKQNSLVNAENIMELKENQTIKYNGILVDTQAVQDQEHDNHEQEVQDNNFLLPPTVCNNANYQSNCASHTTSDAPLIASNNDIIVELA
jgi:hypothetical protein